MKPVATIPREHFERKPPHGAPCNKCGVCCMATLCVLGQHFFERAPCPALQPIPDGFQCGLVADPASYSIRTAIHGEARMREAAALIVGAGDGCDARFNGEWRNMEFHRRMERQDALNADKRKAALELWGVSDDG